MDKIFECSLCGKQCIKKKDMKQHMVVHQDERPYSCEICNFSFKRKWQLTKHNEKVHKKRVLKKVVCKVCGWVGKSRRALIDHRIVCVTNVFQCDICKKLFGAKSSLEYHMTAHSSERPFPCDICGACFKHKRNVLTHIQSVHKGQKPVKKVSNPDKIPLCQCEICGKSFYSRFGYSSHIKKIHGDGKPMCPICGKKVSCKKGLTIHLNTHTGEKPYCCEICGRSFTTKDYLKIHARIHTGESPYKCHVCPKSFKQKGSLNGHYRTNHPGLPPVSELKT
uniref:PR domain zinc finger protein 5 n=1 Tax=Cacopsylla melanoneura TaxID=428564 RepID=A0A8D8QAN2_9HEMI